jgi:S-adenosylmethionine decarboxylase
MKRIISVGQSIFIDIYNLEKKFLKLKYLLNILKLLINTLKIKPIQKPIIKKISSSKFKFSGYSILQLIKESHISIHTWPEYNYLAIDIFSCKKIETKKIINVLKNNFNKQIKIKIKEYKREVKI